MRRFYLSTIIAFLAMGLYGQEKDTVQGESTVKLELVWEKEIAIRVKDWWPYMSNFVFLDEEGYNLFSSMSKGSAKAFENKRMLYIGEGKIQFLEGNELKQTKVIDLGNHPYHPFQVEISKNGRNIAVTNRLDLDIPQEGEPVILRLFNSKGELLGEDTVGLPTNVYPLGNDKIVVLEYGEWSHIEVYQRNGTQFDKVQEYDGYFLDYSEDGNYALISVDPNGKNERVIINKYGQEALRYHYDKKAWRGFISPKGNYIAEIMTDEMTEQHMVLFNKHGKVISEHHVQRIGNYHGSFSADERYLCVTPGRWRVYFLKTETGELISEYVDPDTTAGFQSIAISSEPVRFFVGSTIIDPVINRRGLFTTANRGLYIFNSDGLLIEKLKDRFSGAGFGSPLLSAALRCDRNGSHLLVGTPSKLYLYKILKGEGEK